MLGPEGLCMVPEKFCLVHRTDELFRLRDQNEKMKTLLEEWMQTPFFKSEEDWRAWAAPFFKRVELVLKGD